jgi:5-methylcytosine-specific restriction endonuclease McrA
MPSARSPRAAYRRALRDPRWQKKRLQIFARDKWTCQQCGATNKELHVHHRRYEPGLEPWKTPAKDLVTLCRLCHLASHRRPKMKP